MMFSFYVVFPARRKPDPIFTSEKKGKDFILLIDWQIIKVDWITNVQFILFFLSRLFLVTRFREIFHYKAMIPFLPCEMASWILILRYSLSTPRLNFPLGEIFFKILNSRRENLQHVLRVARQKGHSLVRHCVIHSNSLKHFPIDHLVVWRGKSADK